MNDWGETCDECGGRVREGHEVYHERWAETCVDCDGPVREGHEPYYELLCEYHFKDRFPTGKHNRKPVNPPSKKRKRDVEGVKLEKNALLVGYSSDRKIRNIIKRNKKESPLLTLPSNIRNKILHYVFSHLRIRINCEKDGFYDVWHPTRNLLTGHEFRRGETSCIISGISFPDQFNSKHAIRTRQPLMEIDLSGHNRQFSIHYHKEKVTKVNQVCRQLYQESTLLLYSAPAYSFTNRKAMDRWLMQLRPVQKRAIQTLIMGSHKPKPSQLKKLTGLKLILEHQHEDPEQAALWEKLGVKVCWNIE